MERVVSIKCVWYTTTNVLAWNTASTENVYILRIILVGDDGNRPAPCFRCAETIPNIVPFHKRAIDNRPYNNYIFCAMLLLRA